ncbi:MAG: hypothetical protein R3C26_19050 [Calditrichia bacterium]
MEFSPRAALVFKLNNTNSLRATYNRAVTLPGNNSLNLDIVAGTAGGGLITVRGRGAAVATWQRNSAYGTFANSDLVARSLNPATLGAAQPVGLPLDAVYGTVYNGLAAIPLKHSSNCWLQMVSPHCHCKALARWLPCSARRLHRLTVSQMVCWEL